MKGTSFNDFFKRSLADKAFLKEWIRLVYQDKCLGNIENFKEPDTKYNYKKIIEDLSLADKVHLYKENNYIYFLSQDLNIGSILLEEYDDKIVIWSESLKHIPYEIVYSTFKKYVEVPIYSVFIETKKEEAAILSLGGQKTNFFSEDCETYNKEIGSYII